MAKTLKKQYIGDGVTSTFGIGSLTSGFVPVLEVNGIAKAFTYAALTLTPTAVPSLHDIVSVFETDEVLQVKEVYTDKLTDVVAALQSDAGSFSTPNASTQAYIRTDSGTKTLLAANATIDRIVLIVVRITTAFAVGDGAKPTVIFGETSSTSKFAAVSVIVTAAAEQIFVFTGTLSATKACLATLVAATGTTSTGAYTVQAFAFPAVA
jgi:hypothetical protein